MKKRRNAALLYNILKNFDMGVMVAYLGSYRLGYAYLSRYGIRTLVLEYATLPEGISP